MSVKHSKQVEGGVACDPVLCPIASEAKQLRRAGELLEFKNQNARQSTRGGPRRRVDPPSTGDPHGPDPVWRMPNQTVRWGDGDGFGVILFFFFSRLACPPHSSQNCKGGGCDGVLSLALVQVPRSSKIDQMVVVWGKLPVIG